MAEKNIKLKNGEDIVYPQTKIGNILNDDGTKLQNFGNAKYWVDMSQYMPLTYERVYTKQLSEEVYNMLIEYGKDQNFEGFYTFNEHGKKTIYTHIKANNEGALLYQYIYGDKSFDNRMNTVKNGYWIVNPNRNVQTVNYQYSYLPRYGGFTITTPDGERHSYNDNFLISIELIEKGNSGGNLIHICNMFPYKVQNGYMLEFKYGSDSYQQYSYKIPDTIYFDIASNSNSENPNTLTSDGLSNLNDLFTNNRLIGIIYENKYYKLSKNDINNNNYIFVCVDCDNNNYSLKIFTINSTTGVYSSNEMIPSNG